MVAKPLNVAVLGATGAVGTAMLESLVAREFPFAELYPLASERSAGRILHCGARQLVVQDAAQFDFSRVQLALFSAGAELSKRYAPRAVAAGCLVIDNTSCFRYEDDVPLVVPEVNPESISHWRRRHIIANPNCSTIQLVVALKPLHDVAGVGRVNVATYQAVSGAGRNGVEALRQQSEAILAERQPSVENTPFPVPIAFNVLPHIDRFEDNGYTREEMKMVWETRKILADQSIAINPSCVRVPVFYGHSMAVHLETRKPLGAVKARELLRSAPGLRLLDEVRDAGYPTPTQQAAGRDEVWVGRLRDDISHPRGLSMWVVSDNLRKGAALNSVEIAELWLRHASA